MNIKLKEKLNNPAVILYRATADACGFAKYSYIMNELRKVDVSSNAKFQKTYTSYYSVRRDKKWLAKYYSFLEKNKNNPGLSFAEVIRFVSSLKHKTKKGEITAVEASFASKLLATVNPDNPTLDRNVFAALGIKQESNKEKQERIKDLIDIFLKFSEAVKSFITTLEGQKTIRFFDKFFPDYKWISPFKKIDFCLWNHGIN